MTAELEKLAARKAAQDTADGLAAAASGLARVESKVDRLEAKVDKLIAGLAAKPATKGAP